jgi:pyrroline-5-carboxylate reductase
MKITIVGVGRLGGVFARVFSKAHEVVLIDRDHAHALSVASETGAKAEKDLAKAALSEMVVVTVKPAHLKEVIEQLKGARLIVSCAAGIPIKTIESWGGTNVIRVMPNICAEANEAVIAYAVHPESESRVKPFLTAFSSLGMCFRADESHLDPLTAVSGSGPAFVAFLAQAMVDEAIAQGLDKELAEKAVAQTFVGTGKMMLSGEWPTKRIIETVASPGGTTEAGLRMLEEKKTNKAIHEAVRFATQKAKELGK